MRMYNSTYTAVILLHHGTDVPTVFGNHVCQAYSSVSHGACVYQIYMVGSKKVDVIVQVITTGHKM